jgi:hypothetical protein
MRTLIALLALGVLWQQPSRPSVIQDGDPHGDPPYLLEDGWEPLLNGTDLSGWKSCEPGAKNEWYTTKSVRYERFLGPTQLNGRAAPSGVILNGPMGRTGNICTTRELGDIEIYLEFMLAKGSNSGVYLQGLYEIQIFDSWGTTGAMKTSDGGSIYHRWIDEQGVGGSPALVNASRRPGEWQSYQAWFRGPRFDAAGRKIEPARFLRVLFNGELVQKDAAVDGPTRAHLGVPEGPQNPLMIQGDHGPVAFRNIHVRPLRPLVLR